MLLALNGFKYSVYPKTVSGIPELVTALSLMCPLKVYELEL